MADNSIKAEDKTIKTVSLNTHTDIASSVQKPSTTEVSSDELIQVLSGLDEAFNLDKTPLLNSSELVEDSSTLSAEQLEKLTQSLIPESLRKQSEQLIEKIRENPTEYLPSLCEKGKLSQEKVQDFLASSKERLSKKLEEFLDSLQTGLGEEEEPQEPDYKFCSYQSTASYANLAQVLSEMAIDEAFLQNALTQSSLDESEREAKIEQFLTEETARDLEDATKAYHDYLKKLHDLKRKQKQQGALSHVLGALSVALAVCTMNPALIAVAVAFEIDNEVSMATGKETVVQTAAKGIGKGIQSAVNGMGGHMSDKAAKLAGDIVLTVVMSLAVGACAGAGVALITSATLMQSTGTFTDTAECVIADLGVDENSKIANDIRMTCQVVGAFICLGVTLFGGSQMGAAAISKIESENLQKVLIAALAILVTATVSATIASAVYSGEMAQDLTDMARKSKAYEEQMAALNFNQSFLDQFSSTTDSITGSYSDQIKAISDTLNAALMDSAASARATVTRA